MDRDIKNLIIGEYLTGYSVKDIARRYDITEGSVDRILTESFTVANNIDDEDS